MNCKQNTVKRLKLLGLIDNADISLTLVDACDLLGVIGVSFIPSTVIVDRHVFYPGVTMRYGSEWEDVEDIWPGDEADLNGWDSFGQALKESLDKGVEWLVANKTVVLTDAQMIKLAGVQAGIFGASSSSFAPTNSQPPQTPAGVIPGSGGQQLGNSQRQLLDAVFGGQLPPNWQQVNNGKGPVIIGVGPGQGGQINIGPGGVQSIDLGNGFQVDIAPLDSNP